MKRQAISFQNVSAPFFLVAFQRTHRTPPGCGKAVETKRHSHRSRPSPSPKKRTVSLKEHGDKQKQELQTWLQNCNVQYWMENIKKISL